MISCGPDRAPLRQLSADPLAQHQSLRPDYAPIDFDAKIVNPEAGLLLPKFSERMPGQVHLIGVADTGTVTLNQNPWTDGQNRGTLSGAGIGFTWADYNNFVVNTYWAHKLGNAAATSPPDSNSRFWIQVVKFFWQRRSQRTSTEVPLLRSTGSSSHRCCA